VEVLRQYLQPRRRRVVRIAVVSADSSTYLNMDLSSTHMATITTYLSDHPVMTTYMTISSMVLSRLMSTTMEI
jgi:hypothetical protein